MKNSIFTNLPFYFVTAVLLSLLAGCDTTEPVPVFRLDKDYVETGSDSSTVTIGFSIENPREGIFPSIENANADWLSDFEIYESSIRFKVAANDSSFMRETSFYVSYLEQREQFTVRQNGRIDDTPEPPSIVNDDFDVEIDRLRAVSISYRVLPKDPDIAYLSRAVEKSIVDSFDNDDEIFANEIGYYTSVAEDYSLTLETVLERSRTKGESKWFINSMPDGTDFYILSYGIDNDGNRTTAINKYPFTTVALQNTVNMDFEFTFDVDETFVNVTVTPSDPEQIYYWNADLTRFVTEESAVAQYQAYIDALIDMAYWQGSSMSIEDIVANSIAKKGVSSELIQYPYSEADGIGFAFAITPEGYVCSEATFGTFRTGAINASDNVIGIEPQNIQGRSAELNITASVEDDWYVLIVDKAENWEGMSDAKILASLSSDPSRLDGYGYIGSGTVEISGLTRETEYVVFAFGYEFETVTTGLYKSSFTTTDVITADVFARLVVDKYFNAEDLAEINERKYGSMGQMAVIPCHVETSGDIAGYYYHIWDGNMADEQSYSDDDIIAFLTQGGWSDESMEFYTYFDQLRTIVSVGYDKDGNFGPVYREAITFTLDGCSPVSDYVVQTTHSCVIKDSSKTNMGTIHVNMKPR